MEEDDKPIKILLYIVLGALLVAMCVIANVWAMEKPQETMSLGEMSFYQTSPYLNAEEVEFNQLIDRIIQAESGGRIDAQNANSSAHGLCQFLTSTKRYVEQKWDMEIDWDTYEGQYYACERLLKTEGCRHWRESAHIHGCYE